MGDAEVARLAAQDGPRGAGQRGEPAVGLCFGVDVQRSAIGVQLDVAEGAHALEVEHEQVGLGDGARVQLQLSDEWGHVEEVADGVNLARYLLAALVVRADVDVVLVALQAHRLLVPEEAARSEPVGQHHRLVHRAQLVAIVVEVGAPRERVARVVVAFHVVIVEGGGHYFAARKLVQIGTDEEADPFEGAEVAQLVPVDEELERALVGAQAAHERHPQEVARVVQLGRMVADQRVGGVAVDHGAEPVAEGVGLEAVR